MKKTWTIILVVVVILLVGISAYLLGQTRGKADSESKKITTQTVVPSGSMPVVTETAVSSPSAVAKSPVVVLESEGSISALDASELRSRVINPFVDYYAEQNSGLTLTSVKVGPNLGASKETYPYVLDGIFSNGGNVGFLIQKTLGHIDWFVPDCMNGCNLLAEYKAKYPEIAKRTQ